MSACILSESQISLLSKGLNYVPENKMDLFHTCKDINKFVRDITIKKHFFQAKQDDSERITTNREPQDLNSRGLSNSFPLNLDFLEVIATQSLEALYQESTEVEENSDTSWVDSTVNRIRFPNKGFYPIKSRTKDMDVFQHLVEKDLTKINMETINATCKNLTKNV